jgi:glyceraldehyde 3-phosphate dehydrogenase
MAKRLAINGFGRIGRQVYKALVESNMLDGQVELVVVNDLVPAEHLAYLLKYDSVHGRFPYDVRSEGDEIVVGDKRFKVVANKVEPKDLPWRDYGVDIVIEATGFFAKREKAQGHLDAGAGKVIITAPADDVKTFVIGVNHESYSGEDIISNASCTTNCIAPMVKVLLDAGIGLEEGLMTTNHAYTASQMLVDSLGEKDKRGGRAAAINIVPSSTGAAKAVALVLPEMAGKLTGMSFRVPVPNVSVIDLTFKPQRDTSLEEINQVFRAASEGYMKGIIAYTEEELVSSDFNHTSQSCTYDSKACIELNPRFFKLIGWYDNEWGYSNRIKDLIGHVINH